jgi:type II secretory pathway pseudopilin PulG
VGCGCLGLVFAGIIAALALPSFIGQANKAREAEARNNVGAILRSQQAYHLEHNRFAPDLATLQTGITAETANYRYALAVQPDSQSVKVTATPQEETLRSFTGAVFTYPKGSEIGLISGLCRSDTPAIAPPEMPSLDLDLPADPLIVCPPDAVKLEG